MTVPTPGVRAVAAAAATAVGGVLVLGLTLRLEPLSRHASGAAANTLFVLGMTILAGTGALVVREGRHTVIGWLLVATGLANVLGRLGVALAVAAHEAGRGGWASGLGWLSNWCWIPGFGLALVLLLRFPDGHLPGRWRAVAEYVVSAWTVVTCLVTALVPGPLGASVLEPLTNPVGLAGWADVLDLALSVMFTTMPGLLLLVALAVVLRWRRAQDRRQLRTVALAVAFLAGASALAVAAGEATLAEGIAWLVLPASIAYAVARHDLWDVDLRRRLDRLRRVRDAERTRLQHDLHDSLGPLLGSISMRVEAAHNLLDANAPRDRVDEVLASIGAHAESAVVEVRRVLEELEPSALADRGLASALTELVEGHSGGDTRFTLQVSAPLPALSPAAEVALYRVAGEAVRNVVRHARAAHCVISLVAHHDEVELVVTDDGVGLRDQPAGVGRRAMAHRISVIGGQFSVTNNSGRGVRLAARVGAVELA